MSRNERYWTQFVDYLREQGSQLQTRQAYNKSYLDFGIETGFCVRAIARTKKIKVKFVMTTISTHSYFARLRENPTINDAFGRELIWRELQTEKQVVLEGMGIGTENEDSWSYQHKWLAMNLERLIEVFRPCIPELCTDA